MSSLLREDLFKEVLLKPLSSSDANIIRIVAGYATPAMVSYHLEQLKKIERDEVKIEILIGMSVQDGIFSPYKTGFEKLATDHANFDCRYIVTGTPVHSKAYVWYSNERPVCGFIGSANYTQTAFLNGKQREILGNFKPEECKSYFDSIYPDTADIDDYRVGDLLSKYSGIQKRRDLPLQEFLEKVKNISPEDVGAAPLISVNSVTLSFLDKNGDVPEGASGLNWGQRPKRNLNQAYIKVPVDIARQRFFPSKGQHFTVLTDDDKNLICTTAQDSGVEGQGKAIETPHNNSLLGVYFRNRLGLQDGQRVTADHLRRYGRTDVVFSKIDDETYFMDFSKPAT